LPTNRFLQKSAEYFAMALAFADPNSGQPVMASNKRCFRADLNYAPLGRSRQEEKTP
jgi:hypothetical protein